MAIYVAGIISPCMFDENIKKYHVDIEQDVPPSSVPLSAEFFIYDKYVAEKLSKILDLGQPIKTRRHHEKFKLYAGDVFYSAVEMKGSRFVFFKYTIVSPRPAIYAEEETAGLDAE